MSNYQYEYSGNNWIGEKPVHWKLDRLKDIVLINNKVLSAKTSPSYIIQYIDISNVDYSGLISSEAIERLEFEEAPSRARRIVKHGDVIVSSVRPNLQAIAFIDMDDENLICSTGFNVITVEDPRINSRFVYYYILSEFSKNYFTSVAKGVGYPAIADKDFNSLPVLIPTLKEQIAIVTFLDKSCGEIDKVLNLKFGKSILDDENSSCQVNVLRQYRKSLIHEVVTGKKQVYFEEDKTRPSKPKPELTAVV